MRGERISGGPGGNGSSSAARAAAFHAAIIPPASDAVHEDEAGTVSIALRSPGGTTAHITSFGATLTRLSLPDRHGEFDDVVLGHDATGEYIAQQNYLGSSVGRFANRIADGRFDLHGRSYQLNRNHGRHHLHGGAAGFDRLHWSPGALTSGDSASVTLHLVSPDGDQGYPGELTVSAKYQLDDGQLTIEYTATTSAPTIVSLTNHSLFNLAGSRSRRGATGHRLTLYADRFTPIDGELIPTGDLRTVAGTPFDFRKSTPIDHGLSDGSCEQIRAARGYDHNFAISGEPGTLRKAALLEDPLTGRALELWQTAPGLQLYSGNFLDGSIRGKHDRLYRQGDGIALEPQSYPNAPNRPDFPSATLMPGEKYLSTIVYRFSALAK